MYCVLFKAVSVVQSASLCLTCTPAEELAVALRTLLRPLAILRVPVNEIGGCSGLCNAPQEVLRCLSTTPFSPLRAMTIHALMLSKFCECGSEYVIVETLLLPH